MIRKRLKAVPKRPGVAKRIVARRYSDEEDEISNDALLCSTEDKK